jgi:hypothetical protein
MVGILVGVWLDRRSYPHDLWLIMLAAGLLTWPAPVLYSWAVRSPACALRCILRFDRYYFQMLIAGYVDLSLGNVRLLAGLLAAVAWHNDPLC